jgi:hypothetical protein
LERCTGCRFRGKRRAESKNRRRIRLR